MELKYFKTDRNGTKYFYDWTCPRCAGAGHVGVGSVRWLNGFDLYEAIFE